MKGTHVFAIMLAAVGGSICAQSSPSAPQDYGNWLSQYSKTQGSYLKNNGTPMGYGFTVAAGNSLVNVAVGQPGRGLSQGYLASVIPTPGLTASSVCGTTGVRCAADASFTTARSMSSGQGEGLSQARSGGEPLARPPYRANAVTSSHPPLPTFQLLPFPPVFPNQVVTPPYPACDTHSS